MKNQKAITLVALVVTIIILIILASVSIYLVLGNNGIISKTLLAKQNFSDAKELEDATLSNYSDEIEKHISGTRSSSGYKIEKIGEETGIKSIAIDASKYDELYVVGKYGVSDLDYCTISIKTFLLDETEKRFYPTAGYNARVIFGL